MANLLKNLSRLSLNAENAPEETLMSHLIELRSRLMKATLAVIVIFGILMVFPGQQAIFNVLFSPMVGALSVDGINGSKIIVTNPTDSFLIPIKLLFLVAFLGALPYIFYQLYAFIAPGLYKAEKYLVLPVIVSSTLLFFCGIAFCHFIVFAKVFVFFREISPTSVTYMPDIAKVFSFVITLFLAFGITFEIPVIVVLLVRLGMVELSKLREIRSYVIVAAFIIAAIVAPPDVLSQFMLALPMVVLYELGLITAQLLSKPKAINA
jgi:sec-independent protein translocase protein TatC